VSKRKTVKKNPVRDTRAAAPKIKLAERKSPWATPADHPWKWYET